ncbi:hypothetical protein HY389_02270 [Candidatus Daviesbacteria bacterium]|nr:hypothetical protein [Candidatus Daviesbacteria bacterium]
MERLETLWKIQAPEGSDGIIVHQTQKPLDDNLESVLRSVGVVKGSRLLLFSKVLSVIENPYTLKLIIFFRASEEIIEHRGFNLHEIESYRLIYSNRKRPPL